MEPHMTDEKIKHITNVKKIGKYTDKAKKTADINESEALTILKDYMTDIINDINDGNKVKITELGTFRLIKKRDDSLIIKFTPFIQ